MRWPRRRKGTVTVDERGLTALNADTPLRDLAAACYDAGIDLEITASPERAKPDNLQATGCLRHYEDCPDTCPWRTPFQPITSPSGSQAWKARMLAARREALANRVDQGMRDALADATETTANPYSQETDRA